MAFNDIKYFSARIKKAKKQQFLMLCIYSFFLVLIFMPSLYAIDDFFPVPQGYERWIPFWTKVFAEYDSNNLIISDARCPEAIYAVIEIKEQDSHESIFKKKNKKKTDAAANVIEELSSMLDEHIEIKFLQTIDNLKLIYQNCGMNDDIAWHDIRLKLQRGNRDKLKYAIIRYGLYQNKIKSILREKKLPDDISLLPLIESNYWIFARSKAGALGVWQFMPGTGKKYMKINKYIDERMDPVKSTYAAALYLSQAYSALGSWDVTVTSYNYGNLGMIRAVNTLQTNDLSIILKKYKSRNFQYASRNFYLEFLAVRHIMANLNKYFPNLQMLPPLEYKTFKIQHNTPLKNLLTTLKIDPQVFKLYNPAFKEEAYRKNVSVPVDTEIYLPPDAENKSKPKLLAMHYLTSKELSDDILNNIQMPKEELIALNAIDEDSFLKRDKNYIVIYK